MAERITVTTGTVSGVPAPVGPRVARYFITGQTQKGSITPTVVRSMREYVTTFGARSGGSDMYDSAEFWFANNAGELVVCRAYGPSKANATIALDTNKITVTSRAPGSYYNAFSAAYTSASKTLTIVKGSVTAVYTGTDAASLQSAASTDPDVTVAVSALPSSNVSATNLADGTDDFANVNWTTVLAGVTTLYGPGAIAAPGSTGAASALAAHAAANRRLALLGVAQSDSASTVVTAQGAITTANKPYSSYVFGWGRVPDGAGGLKVLDPVTYAATVRAKAISVLGVGVSALSREAHALVGGFTPISEPDGTTFDSLVAAGVITVRTLASGVGIDEWATAAGVNSNANLTGAQYRDLVNAIVDGCATTLDAYVGKPATPLLLAQAESALRGSLDAYKAFLWPQAGPGGHPGYRVTVSNGADLQDNRIQATVSVRFAENVEFVDLVIVPASAAQVI